MPQLGRDFLAACVHVEQSIEAWLPDVDPMTCARPGRHPAPRQAGAAPQDQREALSVREHMGLSLRRLQGKRFVEFAELFDTRQGVPLLSRDLSSPCSSWPRKR